MAGRNDEGDSDDAGSQRDQDTIDRGDEGAFQTMGSNRSWGTLLLSVTVICQYDLSD